MDITNFQLYLQSEEKSSNTIEKYMRDVHKFIEYVGAKELSKDMVIAYKKDLIDNNYAVRSINSMLASVNTYLRFIGRTDCIVKSLRIQRQTYCAEDKELTKADYIRLINVAKSHGNHRLNLIIQTICATGIRVSELQYITFEAVQSGEAVISLKGKTRTVFIVKKLRKKLRDYAKEKGIKTGCIFVTSKGRQINRSNIWREMKNLCVDAGVNSQKVFPHNLRHLFARIYTITSGNEHRKCLEGMRLVI